MAAMDQYEMSSGESFPIDPYQRWLAAVAITCAAVFWIAFTAVVCTPSMHWLLHEWAALAVMGILAVAGSVMSVAAVMCVPTRWPSYLAACLNGAIWFVGVLGVVLWLIIVFVTVLRIVFF